MAENTLKRVLNRVTEASSIHMKESNCLFTCVMTAMVAKSVGVACDVYGGFIVIDDAKTLRHSWIQVGKSVFETNPLVIKGVTEGSSKYFYQSNDYSASVQDKQSLILEAMFVAGKDAKDPHKIGDYSAVIAIALHHLEGSREVMEYARLFVL